MTENMDKFLEVSDKLLFALEQKDAFAITEMTWRDAYNEPLPEPYGTLEDYTNDMENKVLDYLDGIGVLAFTDRESAVSARQEMIQERCVIVIDPNDEPTLDFVEKDDFIEEHAKTITTPNGQEYEYQYDKQTRELYRWTDAGEKIVIEKDIDREAAQKKLLDYAMIDAEYDTFAFYDLDAADRFLADVLKEAVEDGNTAMQAKLTALRHRLMAD